MVNVGRSFVVLREQLLKAVQTDLSPQFINVFVSGRVVQPGGVVVPQGAKPQLNQQGQLGAIQGIESTQVAGMDVPRFKTGYLIQWLNC